MYWKMEHGSVAAIVAIRCGHLAWSLHNFRHRVAEEIAFSISFWHFSSWQQARECCLNPKSNTIKGAQLYKKKKVILCKQSRFGLCHKRGKQKYVALGSHSLATPVKNSLLANFKKPYQGPPSLMRAPPNQLGSKHPGFPSSSHWRDTTTLVPAALH